MLSFVVCALGGALHLHDSVTPPVDGVFGARDVHVSSLGGVHDVPGGHHRHVVDAEPSPDDEDGPGEDEPVAQGSVSLADAPVDVEPDLDTSNKPNLTAEHVVANAVSAAAETADSMAAADARQPRPPPDEEDAPPVSAVRAAGQYLQEGWSRLTDHLLSRPADAAVLASPARAAAVTGLGRGPHGEPPDESKMRSHHCCCHYDSVDDRGREACPSTETRQPMNTPINRVEDIFEYRGLNGCNTGRSHDSCSPSWFDFFGKTIAFPGECMQNNLYPTDALKEFPLGSAPIRTNEGQKLWTAELSGCDAPPASGDGRR